MRMSESLINIFPAYIKARQEMAPIYKDKEGYKFKYADLPQIVEAIDSVTYKNDLAFLQMVGQVGGLRVSSNMKDDVKTSGADFIAVENMLIHKSGEWLSETSETLIDDKMPSRIQCIGASITYARRVGALGFWFMSVEDEVDSRKNNTAIVDNSSKSSSQYSLDLLKFYISASSVPSKTEKAIIDSFYGKISSLEQLNIVSIKHWCDVLSKKLSESK